MATPQQLREEVALVGAQAIAELNALLTDLAGESAASIRSALFDLLPGLTNEYIRLASVIGAEWYDEFRSDLVIPGGFTADLPDLRDPGIDALVRWAEQESADELARLSLISGGIQRRVANGARDAVIDNTTRDPQSRGYQRYSRVSATGCGFCQMLASRGAVYRSESSASFGAHDNCKCVAVPAFDGSPLPVRPYEPTSKIVTDADRARVRDWVKRNTRG